MLSIATISMALLFVQIPPPALGHYEGITALAFQNADSPEDLDTLGVHNVQFFLRCQSPAHPTELVFDDDATGLTSPKFPCGQIVRNERWDPSEGDSFHTRIKFNCKRISRVLEFGCRAVTNHSDNVMVRLEPNRTAGETVITKHRGAWREEEPELQNAATPCVRFFVAVAGGGNFWRCEGPDGANMEGNWKVEFWHCKDGAAYCANLERKLKAMPVCHTLVSNLTVGEVSGDPRWRRYRRGQLQHSSGTAFCSKGGKYERGAVEFFFVGQDRTRPRFSVEEISMDDMIWFDPPPTPPEGQEVFYTSDTLKTSCRLPEYGFSFFPKVTISLNGSVIDTHSLQLSGNANDFVAQFQLRFRDYGPGRYDIECKAPVWNTTEWANRTVRLQVRDRVPPWFPATFQNVTIEEGEDSKELDCDARGEPAPEVSWDGAVAAAGLRSEGRHVTVTRAWAEWAPGAYISCTAQNAFGERATKGFEIHLIGGDSGGEGGGTGISSGTIAGIVVTPLLLIALLGLGLGCLYFKFMRFGRAVVQVLSDDEVKEFCNGRPMSSVSMAVNRGAEEEAALAIDCLPYNSEYEVPKDNLLVDFSLELGSGQYGVVYAGQIKIKQRAGSGPEAVRVAVKTVRPNVPIEYFKALMSELKILAYIGRHDNVARLMGACSSNIKHRELFVGVEYCKTSLLQHLRDNSATFEKGQVETSFGGGCGDYENTESVALPRIMTADELVRWAGEIAAGMEYLSLKRVVHGDLAARNVLLSFDLRAKICDFGLARQLVDYTYIKETKCNLPWKWMAIESLRQSHFSTASDVWSFGVTCWEIFSLGDVPYPCMAWSWEFVEGLVAGNRLGKPTHANDIIFSKMLKCWSEKKEERPKFKELHEFFRGCQDEEEAEGAGGDGGRRAHSAAAYANLGEQTKF